MIFTDQLTVKPYHFFMAFDNADLKAGERVDGMLIWKRQIWPVKGYYASNYTWANRLRYKLYRLGVWLSWRECDLMDEVITRMRLHGFEGVESGWKDIFRRVAKWDHSE
jgi:hypothetical protein